MFEQAVEQVREVLRADIVVVFSHDPAANALVATAISDTPPGRQQRASGRERLPLANGGSMVEVFLSGVASLTGHADRASDGRQGIVNALGLKSQMAAVFKAQTRHRGVVLAGSARSDFFSTDDLRFLEAIARWFGIVIERSELIEQMREQETEQGGPAEELLTIMTHELRNYPQPLRGRLDLMLERAQREGCARRGEQYPHPQPVDARHL